MTELLPFQQGDWNIRVLLRGDEPWFVAKDVCEALSIQNVTQAVDKLDDDERAMFKLGRQGEANIINEAGLYMLILGSRKPEAKSFKRWITHELLPTLRKTGTYQMPTQASVNQHASPDDESFHQVIRAMNSVFRYQGQMTPETFEFLTQKALHRWIEVSESSASGQMLYSPGDLSEILEVSVESVKDFAEKIICYLQRMAAMLPSIRH